MGSKEPTGCLSFEGTSCGTSPQGGLQKLQEHKVTCCMKRINSFIPLISHHFFTQNPLVTSFLPCIKNQSPNNGLQGPASDASACSSPCSLLSSHTASSLFLSHQAHSCILAHALVLPSAWNVSPQKGSCGFLIHHPHVFIQVSPSRLHPIRPPYLNLEDLHLALHIKLPCLLVSIVLLTILQTI